MPQIRYHCIAARDEALALYERLDEAFSDDGVPISIVEIDEGTGVQEVSAYFEDVGAIGEERIQALFDGSDYAIETLPDIDWMASVLAELKPVRAGRFVVHGAHDREKIAANELSIEIEAGLAFGTGHHGTTAGCLEMIDAVARRRKLRSTLDLGTGSAVLAIAIAKLARVPVLASDIDPVAVDVAAANVRANGVASLVETILAKGFASAAFGRRGPFDLIVANVLAGPLMSMAPQMARQLAPGGEIILSGILTRQRRAVLAAYCNQGIYHRQTLTRGEWVTLRLSA